MQYKGSIKEYKGNMNYDSLTNANEQLLLANGSLTVTVVSG